MTFRITTWNVNGIRNPFAYQPWSSDRTFAKMFEILEADIVVMQECKIQRKDLKDDMVLVPGWDVFFSLPKHKKGYSGVAIYTRNATCAPIRAEEGITGLLCPPNSSTSYCNLPEAAHIGGYPTLGQLSECQTDAILLDSEGRCMILEFPAFVLIGVYFPANSMGDRDDFRVSFMIALDARVRNLAALGKKIILTGDLNVIRQEMDTANAEEQMRKNGISGEEYVAASPIRRMFNQLLVDGKVIGARDEEREKGVLWDICRLFHPDRRGMFTCWEQKINARPGNYGSRIDYVLCSDGWQDWFCEANIQEGLMGSDHCPVYAVIKDKVTAGPAEVHIKDIMNPEGMFKDGIRMREWHQKDLLPESAKLIPEFDRRRSIRDMFTGKPLPPVAVTAAPSSTSQASGKIAALPARPFKRSKSSSTKTAPPSALTKGAQKGQSNLMGFFKPQTPTKEKGKPTDHTVENNKTPNAESRSGNDNTSKRRRSSSSEDDNLVTSYGSPSKSNTTVDTDIIDPIVAKESWSKLLSKRVVPKCEHNEPCVSMLTKKAGVNCGRSFFMCPRPMGPSGVKEKGTEWRCGTFIWSSDWTTRSEAQ